MAALREVFAKFGIEVDDSKLKHANEQVNGFAEKLEKVGGLLAGGFVVKELAEWANGLSEQGDEIAKNAIRIGVTGERLQELGFAAGQSGASIEGMKTALLSMSDRLFDASTKGGETAAMFAKLGIKVKDASGHVRSSDEVLLDAAEAIKEMKSPTEQAAQAMNLFGRQGRELLPFLKEGREGIEELTNQAKELGGGFSGDALKASEEFNDAMGRQTFAISSLRGKIAGVLLPVLQKVVDATTKAIAWFTRLAKSTYIIETGLLVLGVALAGFAIKAAIALAPVVAPFILWGIIIGGIALALEDLYVWFKGGKSVIGEWLTALLGAKDAKAVLESVRESVKGISEWVAQTTRDFRDFLRWVDEALTKLSALIGLKNAALAKGNSEDDRQAIRRSAAISGQTVKFNDENPAQAAAGNARAQAELQATRQIQSGAAAAGAAVQNVVNQVFNTGAGMDEAKLARLAGQEAAKAHASNNRAAAQALTREAPKK